MIRNYISFLHSSSTVFGGHYTLKEEKEKTLVKHSELEVGLWTKLFPQALNFIQKIVFQNSII